MPFPVWGLFYIIELVENIERSYRNFNSNFGKGAI